MLISIGEVVDCLNLQPITVIVPATDGDYNSRGKWVKGTDASVLDNVQANVQPATGRTLINSAEGERTSDFVDVILTTHLDTVREVAQTPAFKIVYRGTIWKAVGVPEDWSENGYISALFQDTKKEYTP